MTYDLGWDSIFMTDQNLSCVRRPPPPHYPKWLHFLCLLFAKKIVAGMSLSYIVLLELPYKWLGPLDMIIEFILSWGLGYTTKVPKYYLQNSNKYLKER